MSGKVPNITRLPVDSAPVFYSLVALAIGGWFLSRSWMGLAAFFSGDDIMNMYWSMEVSWGRLLASNLTPFTTEYRPLGTMLYRIMYEVFGLDPLPFRVVSYALLAFNVYLCFSLGRSLTNSAEIGILASLMSSFHSRMFDIYLNNGTIYDVLSGSFYLSSVAYYVGIRRTGLDLLPRQWVVLVMLEIASLNSKETGATIPLVILCYELLYHWPLSPGRDLRLAFPRSRLVGIATLIAVAALAVRARFQPGSRLLHNDGYALRISLKQFLATTGKFAENLLHLRDDSMALTIAIATLAFLATVVFLARSPSVSFAVAFVLITPLPVNFIPPRELYAAYITVFGWAILIAILIVESRNWMYGRVWHRPPLNSNMLEPERFFLAIAVFVGLVFTESNDRPVQWADSRCPLNSVCLFYQDLSRLQPKVAADASILLLSDGFGPEDWTPILLCRLMYRNLQMVVDRPTMFPPDKPITTSKYTLAFRFEGGHLVRGALR